MSELADANVHSKRHLISPHIVSVSVHRQRHIAEMTNFLSGSTE